MSQTIFIIASDRDRAVADAAEDAIERAGAEAVTASPSASDSLWLDAMAARVKEADAALLLASAAGRDDRDMRRALYLALLYDKPLAVGAIGADAGLDVLLDDGELFIGTRQEGDASGLARDLEAAVDVTSGAGGGDAWIDGGAADGAVDSTALKRAVDRARSLASGAPEPDRLARDSMGFPHAPASMLARWRMLDRNGDEDGYRLFRDDYGDDPYFGPRVDALLADYRRQRSRGRMGGVVRGVLGAAAAAAVFSAYSAECSDGSCAGFDPSVLTASTLGGRPEIDDDDLAAVQADNIALREENADLGLALFDARDDIREARARADAAEREVLRLEAMLEDLEEASSVAFADLGDSDDLQRELRRARADRDAALEEVAALERALADADDRIADLEAENASLQSDYDQLAGDNADLQREIEALEAALDAAGDAPIRESRRSEIVISGDVGGATRLLVYYLERLDDENAQRAESPFADLIGGALLRGLDFSILQLCVVTETDLLSEADGIWGARTTQAFLELDFDAAEDVIDCVERETPVREQTG